MRKFILCAFLAAMVGCAMGQGKCTNDPEYHWPMTWFDCNSGACLPQNGQLTIDANWRWTHDRNGFSNCFGLGSGNEWDPQYCDPNSPTCGVDCAAACCVDGITQEKWTKTYGIDNEGNSQEIRFDFITQDTYGTTIGGRVYLMRDKSNYYMFKLLNKEFTFTIDDHELGCGLNGALYFVEMDEDGGMSYPGNDAGAEYGTGYCDAQCPHDIKFISGEANCESWVESSNDPNSGKGKYGSCCMEFDIWEANQWAQAYTSHPCDTVGAERCDTTTTCGDNDSGERYDGVCDKDGSDFASYRMGDHAFWGPGNNYTVDSSRPVTVVTQFITDNGQDNGNLVEIRRLYVQDGRVIQNSVVNQPACPMPPYDSISDPMNADIKACFGDYDHHGVLGGLTKMGEALGRGMVLVMSMWDDHDARMLWLDSNYPVGSDPNVPGHLRGPCPEDSGDPTYVEAQNPDAHVKFSDIKFGPIGSTYP